MTVSSSSCWPFSCRSFCCPVDESAPAFPQKAASGNASPIENAADKEHSASVSQIPVQQLSGQDDEDHSAQDFCVSVPNTVSPAKFIKVKHLESSPLSPLSLAKSSLYAVPGQVFDDEEKSEYPKLKPYIARSPLPPRALLHPGFSDLQGQASHHEGFDLVNEVERLRQRTKSWLRGDTPEDQIETVELEDFIIQVKFPEGGTRYFNTLTEDFVRRPENAPDSDIEV